MSEAIDEDVAATALSPRYREALPRAWHRVPVCLLTDLAAIGLAVTAGCAASISRIDPAADTPGVWLTCFGPTAVLFSSLVVQGRYASEAAARTNALALRASLFTAAAAVASCAVAAWSGYPTSLDMPMLAVTLLAFPGLAAIPCRIGIRPGGQAADNRRAALMIGTSDAAAKARSGVFAVCERGDRALERLDPAELGSDGVQLRAILERLGASHLLIACPPEDRQVIAGHARRRGLPFELLTPTWSPQPAHQPAHQPSHQPLWQSSPWMIRPAPEPGAVSLSPAGAFCPAGKAGKVILDVVAAATLILVLSPVLLALTAMCRLDGGPALFGHRRVGAHRRHFKCLKFRTMVVDADRVLARTLALRPDLAAEWAATHKLQADPRVTRLGHFLRSTSLDELPQLFNVLLLQMSLVGPRPIVDAEVALYGEAIEYYYAAKPGITGLWQVSGRSGTTYAHRVTLDTWYVINRTLWTDIVLLLKTVPVVLSRRGAC